CNVVDAVVPGPGPHPIESVVYRMLRKVRRSADRREAGNIDGRQAEPATETGPQRGEFADAAKALLEAVVTEAEVADERVAQHVRHIGDCVLRDQPALDVAADHGTVRRILPGPIVGIPVTEKSRKLVAEAVVQTSVRFRLAIAKQGVGLVVVERAR